MNSAVVRSIEPADVVDVPDHVRQIGRSARDASGAMSAADSRAKDLALLKVAALLRDGRQQIKRANTLDVDRARKAGVQAALLDRLKLDDDAIEQMAVGVEQVARLSDPIGEIIDLKPRPSGIKVGRMRVPLGVIAIVYESRPNVTVDAAALCLKAGNACILRGGSESLNSNQAIARCIERALKESGLPEDSVQVIDTADRKVVGELLAMSDYVDVV